MSDPVYIHLPAGETPAELSLPPFRAVVVIDQPVTPEWQDLVSDWLVSSGCLYMIAWGRDCTTWDDSVDHANLRAFDYGDVPDDKFVMTTWHDKDPLVEVFCYAKYAAHHPDVDLEQAIIVDISPNDRAESMLTVYRAANWD